MDVTARPGRWETEAQGTRCSEVETGHNAFLEGPMGDTQRSLTISTKLQRIANQAVKNPDMVFKKLSHLIDFEFLLEAYYRTRKNGAPGVDKVTAKEYSEKLMDNLLDLHARLKSNRYKAPPVERVWVDKEGGKKRPIDKPAFEDKIVQKVCVMLLSPIYNHDFYDFSHGFREGHSQHQALQEIRQKCWNLKINWILVADVSGFFVNRQNALVREPLGAIN